MSVRPAVAVAVLILLAPCAASAARVGDLRPAPEEVRARWPGWLVRRDTLHVSHIETTTRPVSFATRLPCDFDVRIQHEDATLTGTATQGIDSFLVEALSGPGSGFCEPTGCAADTARGGDMIELFFEGEGDTVFVQFEPRRGNLAVTDRTGAKWCMRPGLRSATLLGRLAEALPDDLRLPGLFVCPDSTLPDRTQKRDPPTGEYVWVEELPEVVERVPPEYPREARESGTEATVIVRALVGQDGRVRRTLLGNTDPGFRIFYASTVKAVEQYRFKPAKSNGKAIAVWVAIPITFKLND